jgi:hypothetical protein
MWFSFAHVEVATCARALHARSAQGSAEEEEEEGLQGVALHAYVFP